MSRERAGYVRPSRRGTCLRCGKDVQIGRTSRAEGVICLSCRRAAHGLRPDQRVNDHRWGTWVPELVVCPECPTLFVQSRYGQVYCSKECFLRHRYRRGSGKLSATQRGYGVEHQRLRAQLLPDAINTPCHLCGELMLEDQKLHLDHNEDRTGYRGFAHAACNARDGAKRGGQAYRQKVLTQAKERRDAA